MKELEGMLDELTPSGSELRLTGAVAEMFETDDARYSARRIRPTANSA